jgi:hypothetical protein
VCWSLLEVYQLRELPKVVARPSHPQVRAAVIAHCADHANLQFIEGGLDRLMACYTIWIVYSMLLQKSER